MDRNKQLKKKEASERKANLYILWLQLGGLGRCARVRATTNIVLFVVAGPMGDRPKKTTSPNSIYT